jgi:pyruvate formate lyase activating enzyme
MKVASYYSEMADSKVRCELCPHFCSVSEGKSGICKVRTNKEGKLISDVYGFPVALHSDPIEKKPLYHYYPGMQILSLGTYGCNMFCVFCQNCDISQSGMKNHDRHSFVPPEKIIDQALRTENNIGIAYTYNEPAVFFEYMTDIAVLAAKNDLKNVVVTNGFINPKPLSLLLDITDAYNIDIKFFSDKSYRHFTGGSLKTVLQTIQDVAKAGKHLELTHLLIPGLNSNEQEFKNLVHWIASELGPDIPLHISRYFPGNKLSQQPTPPELLKDFYALAAESINHVYLGNLADSFGRDTICQRCGTAVVSRYAYRVITDGLDTSGCCTCCGELIIKHMSYGTNRA